MEKAIWRIIDVNYNRAREGARVVEEFARFVLNCSSLSSRVKKLRHDLCKAVSGLDQNRLLASRDSVHDVGFGLEVAGQLRRSEPMDVFIAAAKRLPEALRALSESISTIDPVIAAAIEKLRYDAYTLEKDIHLSVVTGMKYSKVRLYVLLDGSLGAELDRVARKCIAGGADCLQLRCKNLSDKQVYGLAEVLVGICRESGVISIINDRADIAIAVDADGVHLGQDDISVESVRKLQNSPLIIGLSTHNMAQLSDAIEQRPDYVGIGPAFPTTTKPDIQIAGLDYVRQALDHLSDSGIGHAVIGGVNMENVDRVIEAGARTIAVCSAVTASDDPEGSCRNLKAKLISSGE